jgi:hypothetical protein
MIDSLKFEFFYVSIHSKLRVEYQAKKISFVEGFILALIKTAH